MTNKCKQCNNEYEPKRSTSTYCSPKCRKLAFLNVTVPQRDSVPDVSVPKPNVCHGCGKEVHELICICQPCVSKGVTHKSLGMEMCGLDDDVKKLSKDELYDAISSYEHGNWIDSPEFKELTRRLSKWDSKRLIAEGYKI